jgi:propanediol dehydratase small subunit
VTRAASGRPVDELTLDRVVQGELAAADTRIGPDALRHQAQVAREHGRVQLGENLLRAAELAAFDDAKVLEIYDALRPGRRTAAGLRELAAELARRGAPRCAALVAEAADEYQRRGLTP